ncbi:hypothetical protein CRENBAI_016533 [Crenichthys baileyi]|uniref:Alpha-macroglobulin receptor-binding domain-containing protein n=1 Tax=Crenichthys baileyi TaxID=28760 RepID=A0AAV9S7W4_9TELE
MPFGCGEQNMALLAPNIYILEYLQSIPHLTPAIKEKASNFLTNGYQRQLNYKDSEGAYSTFGSGPGNTWLTAFVLRSFYKAQSFIYIDPTKIEQSKAWLEQKQRRSGCFALSGELFNKRMKGGVSDEVTLSAYITASFLEMKISMNDTVVALQALSIYSSLVFSPVGSSTVTVQSPSGQLVFDVNPDNKLLYQEKMLQDMTGKYSLEVKGTACASVQISQHYNIPPPPGVSTLSVEVNPEFDSSHRSLKVTLGLLSQYNGKEASTNMVILDIALLSGFIPNPQSMTNLMKPVPVNHSLVLLQQIPVQNLKPAVIALYDYYQPSDRAEREYIVANQA